ncbi:MAG: hypothetical protein HON18_15785, partial [Rhodospirillaceae bacterium]|nr:hypothetical protein [Rhodospirillaceae bacterium]
MASDNETTGNDNISLTDVTPFETGDATEIAQAASGADAQPIGTVDTTSGSVIATRVDGTKVELEPGSQVYQGDVIETAGGGSIGVTLADETTFSMAENGNMVLDEMVYDPATQEGSISISAVEGVFTFVSGQIAKTDPDAMTLDTPVATIGIRGTQVGLDVGEGQDTSVVLMEEADGFVGEVVVSNAAGVQILNTAFQGTQITDASTAPSQSYTVNMSDMLQQFGGALNSLPAGNNANQYGTDSAEVSQLIEDAIAAEEAATAEDEDLAEEEGEGEEELAAEEEGATEEELAAEEEGATEEELAAEEEGATEEELAAEEEGATEEELAAEEEGATDEELAEFETAAGDEEELASEEGTVSDEELAAEEGATEEDLAVEDLAVAELGDEELADFETAAGEVSEEELAQAEVVSEVATEELGAEELGSEELSEEGVFEEELATADDPTDAQGVGEAQGQESAEDLANFDTAAGGEFQEEELSIAVASSDDEDLSAADQAALDGSDLNDFETAAGDEDTTEQTGFIDTTATDAAADTAAAAAAAAAAAQAAADAAAQAAADAAAVAAEAAAQAAAD